MLSESKTGSKVDYIKEMKDFFYNLTASENIEILSSQMTAEERLFYVNVYNYVMQDKQREVIAKGIF